jgi:hypothetical protein
MIFAALVAASLTIPVVVDPRDPLPAELGRGQMTVPEKRAVVRPLVSSATECIARTVTKDPRFATAALNELIVDSVPTCVDAVRAMIDAYDRVFGPGAGETFFMGPYLDGLPGAVSRWVRDSK